MPLERESEIGFDPGNWSRLLTRRESKYERLIARAKGVAAAKTIVVHPCDESSLRGAAEAAELGIISPILVGPKDKDHRGSSPEPISISDNLRSSTRRTAMPRLKKASSSFARARASC